jgi:hypothetical protein
MKDGTRHEFADERPPWYIKFSPRRNAPRQQGGKVPDLRSRSVRPVPFLLLLALSAGAARAGADTFNILSFTPPAPPAKWEKTVSGTTYVRFKGYNAKRTAFCEFNIFGSRASAGTARKDFEDESAGNI